MEVATQVPTRVRAKEANSSNRRNEKARGADHPGKSGVVTMAVICSPALTIYFCQRISSSQPELSNSLEQPQ